MITLVLGGARSGKSAYAAGLAAAAQRAGHEIVFIATARAGDAEMRTRIERHRAERPASWSTIEEPLHLGAALRREVRTGRCVLVDCLTLWLTNLIAPLPGSTTSDLAAERDSLLGALRDVQGELVLVGNEIGQGVMPLDALTRRFVDEAGWLHQAIAQRADRVLWMVAGIAVAAKGTLPHTP